MCSVVGCDSWRRSAQRFRLPEDPERRLEWVQFLATVNKQRFRESSWTDITICREHFTDGSFENLTPGHAGETGSVQARLKPHAAPSLGLQSDPDRPETNVDCQNCVAAPTDANHNVVPEIVAVIDEESDAADESEGSSGQGDMDSDEDWKPVKSEEAVDMGVKKDEEEEDEEQEEEDDSDDYPPLPKHSELCPDCGRFFYTRRPHTCEHKIKPYPCMMCGKRCVSEIALKSHNRIHNENYEHRCKYCHAAFKTKVDKVTHEQRHVIQGKPYKCPDCSETFATNKERRIHLEHHRGPQQLKCHICGIEFLWPLSLQRHLAVHTGLKPYKCSVCQRGFNQPSHLKSHMRLHTGERPFKCQHCDKCFNHNVSLKSHIQRCHTSNSGLERKRETITDRRSDLGAAESDGNKRGADSGLDIMEEEQDTDVEERPHTPKKSKRSTGRPIGRPRSYEPAHIDPGVQVEVPSLNSKTGRTQMRKVQRKLCSDEETEDEQRDSDTSFNSAGEEDEGSKTGVKNATRYRGRVNISDCDSNFDPGEIKKKRYNKRNCGKRSGKRRGRPRKNPVV